LRQMRDKGVVSAQKEGQNVSYTLIDNRFAKGIQMIHGALFDIMRKKANKTLSKTR